MRKTLCIFEHVLILFIVLDYSYAISLIQVILAQPLITVQQIHSLALHFGKLTRIIIISTTTTSNTVHNYALQDGT